MFEIRMLTYLSERGFVRIKSKKKKKKDVSIKMIMLLWGRRIILLTPFNNLVGHLAPSEGNWIKRYI